MTESDTFFPPSYDEATSADFLLESKQDYTGTCLPPSYNEVISADDLVGIKISVDVIDEPS